MVLGDEHFLISDNCYRNYNRVGWSICTENEITYENSVFIDYPEVKEIEYFQII